MARLIAKTPLEGLLPVETAPALLVAADPGPMHWIAPYQGQDKAASALLKSALGLTMPAPGRTAAKAAARLHWWGRGQAMLFGAAPPEGLEALAAVVDQSDGWAVLRLEGPGAEAVLARLVPVDLRERVFPRGHTARTQLFHMTCAITRIAPVGFEIMVMRSMAATAVHDLSVAMKSVAAQGLHVSDGPAVRRTDT